MENPLCYFNVTVLKVSVPELFQIDKANNSYLVTIQIDIMISKQLMWLVACECPWIAIFKEF